jgi:hypothetical protein
MFEAIKIQCEANVKMQQVTEQVKTTHALIPLPAPLALGGET